MDVQISCLLDSFRQTLLFRINELRVQKNPWAEIRAQVLLSSAVRTISYVEISHYRLSIFLNGSTG
jgi:hypothetical protein